MEQPYDQDAQDQQYLDQQAIPPSEERPAPDGYAEGGGGSFDNRNGLNAQGHGAVGVGLSPPRPPQVESGPFTQSDKLQMQKLQAGLSQTQSDQYSGKISDKLGYAMRQRISAELQPLMQKQQASQKQQQQEMQQTAMQQAAMQEGISNVHLKTRAQGFAGTVATHIDPNTGRMTQLMPRMGAHGLTHYEPVSPKDVDPDAGPGVEDFQTLLQRAQQQHQPPQGVGPRFLRGPRGPRANPYWMQWEKQTNDQAKQWHTEQIREQQLVERKAQMGQGPPQGEFGQQDLQQNLVQHPQIPGVWFGRDAHGKYYKVHDAKDGQADLAKQKADQQGQKDSETMAHAKDIESRHDKAKESIIADLSKNEMVGEGVNAKPTGRKTLPSDVEVSEHLRRLHPRLVEQYEKVQRWRDKHFAKQFGGPPEANPVEESLLSGEPQKKESPPDQDKSAIDKGLGN